MLEEQCRKAECEILTEDVIECMGATLRPFNAAQLINGVCEIQATVHHLTLVNRVVCIRIPVSSLCDTAAFLLLDFLHLSRRTFAFSMRKLWGAPVPEH